MARLLDDASSQYLECSGAPATAVPLTMACWYNADDISLMHTLMCVTNPASSSYNSIIPLSSGGLKMRAYSGGSATVYAQTASAPSEDTWEHVCAVWAATDDRRVYLNGGSKGTNTDTSTQVAFTQTNIGTTDNWGNKWYFSGAIAEAAIWTAALSDDEVAILAEGYSPLLVRPASLAAYWPLIRDEDQDRVGGYDLTPANSPTIATHPGVVRYAIQPLLGLAAGAAPPPPTAASQFMMLGVG